MSILESPSVTYLPLVKTIEDMTLWKHLLLGTVSFFLKTNNRIQALIGACFCHWLLCFCLCISLGLSCSKQIKGRDYYLSPAQEGVYPESANTQRKENQKHWYAKPTTQVPGNREHHAHSGCLMTFPGFRATVGLLARSPWGSVSVHATWTSL